LNDDNKAYYLSWPRKRELLAEYAGLSPGATVVTCGGEPMLDLEEFFDLSRECRRLGLRCLSVTNGTKVNHPHIADRMIDEGPHEITVSLNSRLQEVHDRTRGVKGSFRMAVNALRLLLRARSNQSEKEPEKETGMKPRIYAMAVICEQTYRDLDAFYDFVLNDVGADKLKLNILQPTFGGTGPDAFFADNTVADYEELGRVIERCDAKYNLGINPRWLAQVKMYFRSVATARDPAQGWAIGDGTEEHICNTYERNVMVDLFGTARLCFSLVFPGFRLHKPGDLRRFWYEVSNPIRATMEGCNRHCGISHSVRRENATLKPPPDLERARGGNLESVEASSRPNRCR
jgi:MoaA/NifB/PqqE/SkfB family radical SAM enzyme